MSPTQKYRLLLEYIEAKHSAAEAASQNARNGRDAEMEHGKALALAEVLRFAEGLRK